MNKEVTAPAPCVQKPETSQSWFITSVQTHLEKLAKEYNFTLLFAGLSGSQAKGYPNPFSDHNYYVVYHGKILPYLKAIGVSAPHLHASENLPVQVAIDIQDPDIEGYSSTIQLNFISFKYFVGKIGKSNMNIRIALDNIHLSWTSPALIELLHEFANSSFDPSKYKCQGLKRAQAVREMYLSKAQALLDNNLPINASKVMEGLYRLFMAWAVTSEHCISFISENKTQTLDDLLCHYLKENPDDQQVQSLRHLVVMVNNRGFLNDDAGKEWLNTIDAVIKRLSPVIQLRVAHLTPRDTLQAQSTQLLMQCL